MYLEISGFFYESQPRFFLAKNNYMHTFTLKYVSYLKLIFLHHINCRKWFVSFKKCPESLVHFYTVTHFIRQTRPLGHTVFCAPRVPNQMRIKDIYKCICPLAYLNKFHTLTQLRPACGSVNNPLSKNPFYLNFFLYKFEKYFFLTFFKPSHCI